VSELIKCGDIVVFEPRCFRAPRCCKAARQARSPRLPAMRRRSARTQDTTEHRSRKKTYMTSRSAWVSSTWSSASVTPVRFALPPLLPRSRSGRNGRYHAALIRASRQVEAPKNRFQGLVGLDSVACWPRYVSYVACGLGFAGRDSEWHGASAVASAYIKSRSRSSVFNIRHECFDCGCPA
jgi:hypothetical protein